MWKTITHYSYSLCKSVQLKMFNIDQIKEMTSRLFTEIKPLFYRCLSFSRASNSNGISSPGKTSLHWLTLCGSSVPVLWISEMESALLLCDSATLQVNIKKNHPRSPKIMHYILILTSLTHTKKSLFNFMAAAGNELKKTAILPYFTSFPTKL